MLSSVQTFLRKIIDYAGLFPPAALDMKTAVENFARYRTHPQGWMLSRFICPVGKLDEFADLARDHLEVGSEPWAVSVLGRGGDDATAFLKATWADAAETANLAEQGEGLIIPDMMELRIPASVLQNGTSSDVDHLLDGALEVLASHAFHPRTVFFEIPFPPGWRESMPSVFRSLASHRGRDSGVSLGAKIRTGGTEPDAFPDPEEVTRFILEARDHGVPFKATAGLHHPVRHFSPLLGVEMHGFFNVFGGAILARHLGLDARALKAVILEENGSRFQFDEDGFVWGRERIGLDGILEGRRELAQSFGSCSFTEPREDLEVLELL